jgi:arabinan endo-1,5-alpha-L-arabinosidase
MTPRFLPVLAAATGTALCLSLAVGQTAPPATGPATAAAQGRGRGRGPAQPVDPALAARMVRLGSRGVGVHDPSTIVKCKDDYWLFYTGGGTPSYHSKDLITWERGPQTFTGNLPWVATAVPRNRGAGFWAPDVIKVGDRYLLFYSASSFGVNTSAIGVASNPTLDPADPAYKWTDGGMVIASTPTEDFNCIDPAAVLDAQGQLWLAFGSFWSGIQLIQLDPATGKRLPNTPVRAIAHYDSIEAPYIYHHGDYYYLFVSWGMCCRGVNSTYHTRMGRSKSITGPYLDKEGKDLVDGGGSIVIDTQGPFIGPGHAGIVSDGTREWFSCHFYDGSRNGASTLAIRPLSWSPDGWPVVENPEPPQ